MADPTACENCNNGRHRIEATPDGECLSKRELLPVACRCWCLAPDAPLHRARKDRPLFPGVEYALDMLRRAHVQVRTRSTGLITWKPPPNKMAEKLLHEVRANKMGLQIALAAWNSTLPVLRAGWSHGIVAACFGCGKACVTIDPLGFVRHNWCGWLGQVPIVEPVVQVPMYPYPKPAA